MPLSQAQASAVHAHLLRGENAAAQAALQRAMLRGSDPNADTLMACALSGLMEFDRAMFFADRAAAAVPGALDPVLQRARALVGLGRLDQAYAEYERAHALAPDDPQPWAGMSFVLIERKRFVRAEAVCREALRRHPRDAALLGNLTTCLHEMGLTRQALDVCRDALRDHPRNLRLVAGLAQLSNYVGGLTPAEVFEAHRAHARLLAASGPAPLPAAARDPRDASRRIRLAVLSPDLRRHAVTFFFEPVLRELDKSAFEVSCYSAAPREDEHTDALRPHAARWRRVHTMTDPEIAALIRRDGADILLDLSGLTPGHRLGAVRLRPAPVQVTYLGSVSTTGLDEVDYRIVDSVTGPPGSEGHTTEALLRVDPCFLCYRPYPGGPAVAPPPCAAGPDMPITFGSFNNLAKLDDGCVALWSRLLHATPGSRLALMHTSTADPEIAGVVRPRFEAHGVSADRVLVLSPPPTLPDIFTRYAEIDIALDTFPFGGGTTTCDALYYGAPVVAMEGDRHAARHAASILRAAGMADLVARTPEEYLAIARTLASDRTTLARRRSSQRERFLDSPVCDAPAFARRFESALRGAWARWCAGERAG